MLCQSKFNGWRQRCQTRMVEWVDAIGRLHWSCPRCEAVRQGRCWQCSRPRRSLQKTQFCPTCKLERHRRRKRKYNKTEAGRANRIRYHSTDKAKAVRRARRARQRRACQPGLDALG